MKEIRRSGMLNAAKDANLHLIQRKPVLFVTRQQPQTHERVAHGNGKLNA